MAGTSANVHHFVASASRIRADTDRKYGGAARLAICNCGDHALPEITGISAADAGKSEFGGAIGMTLGRRLHKH